MSLMIAKCRRCKSNDIQIEIGSRGTQNKKYCEPCATKIKNEYRQRKNRYQRCQRLYPQLRINLVKNYVYFAEGLRK